VASLCFASAVIAESVTPAEKVVNLLEDLKTTSEEELKKETKLFTTFLTFAEGKLVEKQAAIDTDNQNIETANADIDGAKAGIKKAQTAFAKAKAKEIKKSQALSDKTEQWEATKAELEKTLTDLTKAVSSLEKAIEHLTTAKETNFLSLKETIRPNLKLADALGIATHSVSLLQGPGAYEYHSNDIIGILSTLNKEFSDKKTEVEHEKASGQEAFTEFKEAAETAISAAQDTQETEKGNEETQTQALGKAEQDLQNATIDLKNDSQYHKDLDERYKLKSAQWAQRKQGREDEIAALEGALTQLATASGKEVERTEKKDFLQEPETTETKLDAPKEMDVKKEKPVTSFLQARRVLTSITADEEKPVFHVKAAALLLAQGKALKSATLESLSHQMTGSFDKVKKLIQELIERLLSEGSNEADHQGKCATDRKEAEMNRLHRSEDIERTNADLASLTAFRDELEQTISTLSDEIDELEKTLSKEAKMRSEDKEANLEAIKDAKEGLDALKAATQILTEYYKGVHGVGGADTARVLVQTSPVEEEEEWKGVGGIKGAYKGSQGAAGNIFGLLEVIRTDFEREIRTTQTDEKETQAEYVIQTRDNNASLTTKKTQKANADKDLKVTKSQIEIGFNDLRSASERQGEAIKILDLLWKRCVAVEMTWEERKAKIEKEIEALKKAVKALEPPSVA